MAQIRKFIPKLLLKEYYQLFVFQFDTVLHCLIVLVLKTLNEIYQWYNAFFVIGSC